MKLDPQEQKRGFIWLFVAGSFAILLTFALYTVDQTLTHSTAEAELGNTLRELRGAQTSIKSANVDPRQALGAADSALSLRAVSTAELDQLEAETHTAEHENH